MKTEEILVPRGDGKDAIKERERIIREFYKEWRGSHEGQKMYNLHLKEFINIRQVSLIETVEHAAKSYLSTLAVLQLDAILTNARKISTVPADKNTTNQPTKVRQDDHYALYLPRNWPCQAYCRRCPSHARQSPVLYYRITERAAAEKRKAS